MGLHRLRAVRLDWDAYGRAKAHSATASPNSKHPHPPFSLETPSRRGALAPNFRASVGGLCVALGSRSSARSVIVTPSAVATSQILARLAERYPLVFAAVAFVAVAFGAGGLRRRWSSAQVVFAGAFFAAVFFGALVVRLSATSCLNVAPTLNPTARVAASCNWAPVEGLRAVRAPRSRGFERAEPGKLNLLPGRHGSPYLRQGGGDRGLDLRAGQFGRSSHRVDQLSTVHQFLQAVVGQLPVIVARRETESTQ